MFETIVIGCDGTTATREAIALAEQLREPATGKLVLVSVFPFYRNFAVAPLMYTEWLKETAEEDLAIAERWVSEGVPHEKRTIASPSAASGLDDVASSVGADLIVLGPSHYGVAGRATGRTTVQRMLHGAPCALAVTAEDQEQRLHGDGVITVAYDDSPEAHLALTTAYAIARVSGSRVRIVTALEPIVYASGFGGPIPTPAFDTEREQSGHELLAAVLAEAPADLEVETKLAWGPARDVILDVAGDDTELIVAGSRGYGPVRRVLAGAVSSALLANGRVPVLVTPRAAAARAEEPLTVGDGAAC